MYQPKENEVLIAVKPVGVKYICEYCHEGEMKYDSIHVEDFQDPATRHLHRHVCTNCKKILFLPKPYPYIEWSPDE